MLEIEFAKAKSRRASSRAANAKRIAPSVGVRIPVTTAIAGRGWERHAVLE
jgi:hypothetical protein